LCHHSDEERIDFQRVKLRSLKTHREGLFARMLRTRFTFGCIASWPYERGVSESNISWRFRNIGENSPPPHEYPWKEILRELIPTGEGSLKQQLIGGIEGQSVWGVDKVFWKTIIRPKWSS